jgi:hydrogenase maturation protein HypF
MEPVEPLFTEAETLLLRSMLARGLNAPLTSSIGRLFDAVAALSGVRTLRGFEGQAAMELEFAAEDPPAAGTYPWTFQSGEVLVADPGAMVQAILDDRRQGVPAGLIARRFHHALADLALAWARHGGVADVVLCGGCFQNALLLDLVGSRLAEAGFQVHIPRRYPPNDGAISLGQAWVAAQQP